MPAGTKRLRLFGAVIGALLLSAQSVPAQSVVNLPRVVQQKGRFTGIAVSNPSNFASTLTLQVFDETGNPISFSGSSKSATLKLAPGAQFAQFDNQLFPITSTFRGWARIVSSDNVNLRGFYLIGDDAVTVLDGTNGARPYREQILPFLANDAKTDTEINIINPTDQVAIATLRTITFDGTLSEFGASALTLQPHAVFRKSTKEIFNSSDYSLGAYYSISSNVGLLAMELVENHVEPSLACLNGVDVNAADRTLNFPHAVLGGDYFSLLGVINLLDIPQTVSISLFQEDGTLVNTGSVRNPISITLDPKASTRISLADLFHLQSSLGELLSGWVKVESNFGPITGFAAYGNFSNPTLAAVTPQIRPFNQMVFSHLAPQSLGYFTGLALLNVNSTSASVRLAVLDKSGMTVATQDLKLASGHKIAKLISELIPEAKEQVGGSLLVSSDQPFYGMELFGSTNFSVLANVPPDEIDSSFTPPDKGLFLLSGKLAQDNDAPLPNATVQLSGSVQGISVKTNERGEYVFLNVPAGNYAVEPSLKNFDFAPAALSVSIANSSVGGVDFQGKRLPNLAITSVTPPNGPVGSPVTLHGNGFSSISSENSVHFFGTFSAAVVLRNPPPTDEAITVLVPGSAVTGPVVVNVGSSVSNSVQFSVTEANPTSLSLPASVPSSVAISGLGNLAVVGHRESDTVSLVSLTPNPSFIQNLSFPKSARSEITAVATDDDGTGGATSRDDGIGFFNIELLAFKSLQSKVARFGAKVDRPSQSSDSSLPLTSGDVHFLQLPPGTEPVSLAFEPFGRFAMTANRGTDSLSFFEFLPKAVPVLRGNLSLSPGSRPVSVSVAANGRRALVANSGTNSVSIIEFASTPNGFLSGNLRPVITRNFLLNSSPNSVAINLDAARGVTANADNTASILNLNGPADSSAITTVPLPVFSPGTPSAVSAAMAPNGSYAIVTSRDLQGNSFLSVISLDGIPEVSYVQVLPKNSGTSAVTIGPNSSSFMVANPLLGNVSVFNPVPGDVSLATLSLSRAEVRQRVTLFGSGFSADPTRNVVRFRGQNQAGIPAAVLSTSSNNMITVEVPVGATSGPVTVNVGRLSSNEQFFVVLPTGQSGVIPLIERVTPRSLTRRLDNNLAIQGRGFSEQSIVEVDFNNGQGPQLLTSVFTGASVKIVDATQIQVFISGQDLVGAPSRLSVDVLNPPPGGGRSNSVDLLVTGSSGHDPFDEP